MGFCGFNVAIDMIEHTQVNRMLIDKFPWQQIQWYLLLFYTIYERAGSGGGRVVTL